MVFHTTLDKRMMVNVVAITVSSKTAAVTTMGTTTAHTIPTTHDIPKEEELEQIMREIKSHMSSVRSLLDRERDSVKALEQHDHDLSMEQEEIIDQILAEQGDESDGEGFVEARNSCSNSKIEDDDEEEYSLSPEQQKLVEELLRDEEEEANNTFEASNMKEEIE